MDDTAAVLLLSELPGIGQKALGAMLRRCAVLGDPLHSAVDWTDESFRDLGLTKRSIGALRAVTAELRSAAEAAARGLGAAGVSVLIQASPAYPRRLLERLDTPPPILFAYGTTTVLSAPTFAVANSNGTSEEALALSDAATDHLVQRGWRPVTGHNRPAYQRTALSGLRYGAPVCYVLDRGLLEAFDDDLTRELFPAAHIWSRRYDPATTLTLSPFPLRAHGIALHNRERDELIFALADTILVGKLRAGGQMERCVRHALAQGRPVCLVGPETDRDEELMAAGAVRNLPTPD